MTKSIKKRNSDSLFNKLFNNKIVNNKVTLFVVAFIALISLLGHIIQSEFSAILLFFLVGALAYSFTKNMTVVLGSAFVITSIANMSSSMFVYQEGMVDSSGNDSSGNPITTRRLSTTEGSNEDDTEGLSQLTPALLNNTPNKEQMQKQLGKATEMEQAYDNIEKIMGKDNIQAISTDTKDLIRQQNELIKQLKTMTPALNDAMSSLGSLDLSKLTSMFTSATKALSDTKTA
jgi:hypothetical protein